MIFFSRMNTIWQGHAQRKTGESTLQRKHAVSGCWNVDIVVRTPWESVKMQRHRQYRLCTLIAETFPETVSDVHVSDLGNRVTLCDGMKYEIILLRRGVAYDPWSFLGIARHFSYEASLAHARSCEEESEEKWLLPSWCDVQSLVGGGEELGKYTFPVRQGNVVMLQDFTDVNVALNCFYGKQPEYSSVVRFIKFETKHLCEALPTLFLECLVRQVKLEKCWLSAPKCLED